MQTTLDPTCLLEEGYLDALFFRHTQKIKRSFEQLKISGVDGVDFDNVELVNPLVGMIVDRYISDHQILKLRYGIRSKMELHRVAGLLASAILRYRPLHVTSAKPSLREAQLNEHFALFIGIGICSQGHVREGESLADILSANPLFQGWFRRMKYLLAYRNYTTESLIFIFETLSISFFPQNFSLDRVYHPGAGEGRKL